MRNTVSIQISPGNLRHNYGLLKGIGSTAQVYAVVKSDAYGHGLLNVARALPEADGFALIQLDDAIALRDAGVSQPILLMGGASEFQEIAAARMHRLAVVVHQPDQLAMLRAPGSGHSLDVWVKVNSQMNRFGFEPGEVPGVLQALHAMPNVAVRGLMMHFPSAHRLDLPSDGCWAEFQRLVKATNLPFSVANSAAMLSEKCTHGDLIRAGAALYGINPFFEASAFGARPAMQFRARIVAAKNLSEGDAIGYNGLFVAQRAMRAGVVACGYGDGYPATASIGTPVSVAGVRAPTVGKVAMNTIFIDLSDIREAGVGDWVTLWGDDVVRIEDVARTSGLAAAAIACGMSKKHVCAIE